MNLNIFKNCETKAVKDADFMAFFREKQQIVICVVAVVLLADFLWFGCLPLYKAKRSVRQRKAALTQDVIKDRTYGQQLPELKVQLQKLQRNVSNFELNVPKQRALGGFLKQIANLMTENNLSEQVVVPGREIESDGLSCIPINIKCKGRLVQVSEFYKQLQGLDRLVRIEQGLLSNDGEFSGQVSMETKAFIYCRPEVKPAIRTIGDSEKI